MIGDYYLLTCCKLGLRLEVSLEMRVEERALHEAGSTQTGNN